MTHSILSLLLRAHQDDAPKPNNRDVCIIHLRRRAVWVDTFDSPLLTESDIIRRGWRLIKDLEHMGRKVDSRFFLFSLYEPPLPLVPHHYEIAVRAKCRRHNAGGVNSSSTASGVPNDWDDDYPFPEADGGDDVDDDCEDDAPDLPEIMAAL